MENLYQHLNSFISIEQQEFDEVALYFQQIELKKKETLTSFKKASDHLFFVLKGCLNMYFVNEKGEKQSVQFAIENWWINDPVNFYRNSESTFCIQAVENSKILCITRKDHEALLEKFPKLERYFRKIYQIAYGASLYRIKYLYQSSKAERYFHFIKHHPQFSKRVPQYLIASFLGLTPEYVSEIRAKGAS
ncbi:Crp/Fnr family transcriptional regulator [Wenyingzhuangia sp. IMCC45574]